MGENFEGEGDRVTLDDIQELYGGSFTCCCAGVGCGDPWHKIIPKLLAVARAALVHVKNGGMMNAQALSDALDALESSDEA